MKYRAESLLLYFYETHWILNGKIYNYRILQLQLNIS